jgi:LuxR family maltose regulon positive regulatory protein
MKNVPKVRKKLNTPQIKGRVLRRERLLKVLRENLDKKLMLICADAGYGKTTLLAQFCEELGHPYVFYDLDSQDNDTATFFNHLILGVRRHHPYFGERVRSVVSEKRSIEIIIGTFINEFVEQAKDEFFIIMDDYHRLQKNRKISNVMNYFLRHLPANLHFIIASRTTPPLYLSYYLAKQELLHLGKEHLQFDIKETKALLREIYKMDIPEEDISRIAELSEGWVTVIQLILQKLSVAGGRVRETLSNYIASGEDVFDYFAQEIFKNQSKAVRDFLMKTSILEFLNPKICDSILRIRTSEKIMNHLETEHIFVLHSGHNLLYHPLFQEFLHKILVSSCSAQYIRGLHNAASEYFYKRKDYSSTVNHLIAARRYARAVKILDKHYDYWHKSNEHADFVQLAERIPDPFAERYPYFLLKKAYMYYDIMKVEHSLLIVDKALRRLRRARDRKGMAQAYNMKSLACHSLMQSQKAFYYAKKAYGLAGRRRSRHKVVIMMNLGNTYRILGRFGKSQAVLKEVLEMTRALKDNMLECEALRNLGMLYYNISEFRKSEEIFMEIATKFRDRVHGLELAYTYRNIASIAVDSGDIDKALDYINRAERISQQYNDYYLNHYLILLRGRVSVYEGDRARAIEFFNRVIELNRKIDIKISDLYALLDLVDVYLKANDVRSAREALDRAQLVLNHGQDIPQHVIGFQVAKGRLETAEGNFSVALVSLKTALRISRKVYDPYQVLAIYHAFSEYYLASGKISKALEWFKKCLVLTQKHEFEAYLVLAGRARMRLFELALEQNYMVDFLMKILERIDTPKAREVLNRIRPGGIAYHLECSYLGGLEIKNQYGHVISPEWRTSRAKMLFIMLSGNHPKGCTREELLNACWPQREVERAVHSLQVEVSSLRKMLHEMVDAEFESDDVISYRNGYYSLNPRLCIKKDVQQFEALVHEAMARESTEHGQSKRLYAQAWQMYRGDFCADLSTDWCTSMRAYYRKMAVDVLKKLAQFNFHEKNFGEALTLYQKVQLLDEYDEAIYIGIMRCLAALKDKDGVQRQYKLLVHTLRELDVSAPSREATEIYEDSLQ